MPTVEYKGKTYEVDEDGFLQDPESWDKDFAAYVKEQEGISELTDEHWKVINYLQDYYKKNGIAPMVRIMTKVTGFKLKKIYELFPSGPGKGACKMAGLAKPTGCV
jgi:tRNA 2-thiouridine synthesizing protein E